VKKGHQHCKFTDKSPLKNFNEKRIAMKKTAMLAVFAAVLTFSCSTSKVVSSTDDVYAVPAEERQKELAIKAQQAKEEELARRQAAEQTQTISISEDKTDSKYYQDPQYSSDDYYDYMYSARINRFYRPIGVGYYDSYYTNMYSYNNNPSFYGTSIYSSYGYGMPSSTFNSISFGISSVFGYGSSYGYGGYGLYNSCYPFYSDPWCGGYNGYGYYGGGYGYPYYGWGYGSWGYMNSYNNGYWNGYYSGLYSSPYGYYNSYDNNSNYRHMAVAPRNSNLGGNSANRESSPRGEESQKYYQNVAQQQDQRPRFNSGGERIMRNQSVPGNQGNGNSNRVYNNGNNGNVPAPRETEGGRGNRSRNEGRIMERQPDYNSPSRREQPIYNVPNNNGGGGRNSGGDGGAPRNSGGGGNSRHH
jgi:hypothetical protein